MKLSDEFYEMLKDADGETVVVADKISKELNDAISRYEDIQEKEKDAENLASHFESFMKTYYPNIAAEFKGSEIIELCNSVEKIFFNEDFDFNKIFGDIFSGVDKKDPGEKKTLS